MLGHADMEAELWAEARTIEEAHGELAPAWIAAEIVARMRAGDHEGEQRMRGLDTLLTQLRHGHPGAALPQRYAPKLS